MQGFGTIINSIVTLGLAMLIGFLCVKTGYITEEQKNALSKIIVRVTLPLLIVTSLTNQQLNHEMLINSIQVLLISLAVIAALYSAGAAISKIAKMEKPKAVMHTCMTAFGNVVFMAYPLISALYGSEGLLYAAVYALANDMFLWTLGVYRLNSINEKETSVTGNLKRLLTPGTAAFTTAFVMMIFGLKFTGVIGDVFTGIGSVTTYMSMLFIGGTLASVNFKKIYRRVWLFALTAVKMIAVPAALALILGMFNLDDTVRAVIILQSAMPASTVLAVLGTEYGGDTIYCAEGVFITHLLGLVLLPLAYYMINVF